MPLLEPPKDRTIIAPPRIECIRCQHKWYISKPQKKAEIHCPVCKGNPFKIPEEKPSYKTEEERKNV